MDALTSWPLMTASCITNWPWPTEKGTRMISNSNCSRTTRAALAGRGAVGVLQHLADDRVAQHEEIAHPQRAGALRGALAVEIDLEIDGAADRVGIEADELEELAGVHGLGPQPALLAGLVADLRGERLAALQHAARVERGQLVGALLQQHLHVAQRGVGIADDRAHLGAQIQARAHLRALVAEMGDVEEGAEEVAAVVGGPLRASRPRCRPGAPCRASRGW